MSVAFCRYLLERRRVDPLAFLDAVDQLRSMTPTLPRLVLDHKLLDHETMLKVFAHQAQQKISFEASCRALAVWNENLESSLERILAEAHQSVFHILLDRQLISPEDLIAAMDEFLATQPEPQAEAGVPEGEAA